MTQAEEDALDVDADHRMLRGDIGGHPWGRDKPRNRGGVNDRTPLLLQHDRQDVAQAEEDALDVDRDDLVERVLVMLGGVRPFAFDAGIVEEAVDRAIGVECCLHIGPHIGRFGDVRGDEMRLAALLPDDTGGSLAAGRIAINDNDFGAAFGESKRRGAADAVPGTSDQRATLPIKSGFLAFLRSICHSRGKRESRAVNTRSLVSGPPLPRGDANVIFGRSAGSIA